MALIAPLLDALLSPVNDTRRSAEQAYEAALSSDPSAVRPDRFPVEQPLRPRPVRPGLLQVASEFIGTLTADPSVSHRSLAAVLLRKVIRDTFAGADGNRIAYWRLFSAETKERVKDGVLQALAREPEQHIRRKLSHVIAETALCAAGKACAEWPALLHVIFGLAGSPDASLRQTGLHVFVQLCDYAGDLIVVPHVAQLQPVLTGLLGDAESRVRVVALEAIIALLKRVEDEGVRASFQPLIPQLFKVLELALGADELQVGPEKEVQPPRRPHSPPILPPPQAREALQALIDLIEDHPVFIRPFVVPVADVMLRIVTHADFDAETRKLALEFLLAVRGGAGAPGAVGEPRLLHVRLCSSRSARRRRCARSPASSSPSWT